MRARSSFELLGSEVHIWTLPTGALHAVSVMFEPVLATDELDRADRFRFGHLRDSFVIGRGALRCLLGRYLDLHPTSIRFIYGSKGKPALDACARIHFNMTHSGSLAAVAITADCQIGLDLEQIRPLSDMQQIAARFFCSEEAAEIMSLPPSERERAFYCCWTRKEAYIKAIGEGLSTPLDSFRVTVLPNTPANFVHLSHGQTDTDAWTLHDLCLAPDYAAAVAYCDQRRSLSIFPIVDLAEFLSSL
jgi:4'-phosphopantetheinyl transferase